MGDGRGVVVRSDSPRPPRRQHRGGQSGFNVQRDIRASSGDSSSVTMLPVANRVARSIMAALTASPAPVVIGSWCPPPPVDYQTGQ